MTLHIEALKHLIKKIGEFIGGLFRSVTKTIKGMPPEKLELLKNAAAVPHIINENLSMDPELLREKITVETGIGGGPIDAIFQKYTEVLNLPPMTPTLEIIKGAQKFLSTKTGQDWANGTDNLYKAGAIALNLFQGGKITLTEIIATGWGIYQTFFRKFKTVAH